MAVAGHTSEAVEVMRTAAQARSIIDTRRAALGGAIRLQSLICRRNPDENSADALLDLIRQSEHTERAGHAWEWILAQWAKQGERGPLSLMRHDLYQHKRRRFNNETKLCEAALADLRESRARACWPAWPRRAR